MEKVGSPNCCVIAKRNRSKFPTSCDVIEDCLTNDLSRKPRLAGRMQRKLYATLYAIKAKMPIAIHRSTLIPSSLNNMSRCRTSAAIPSSRP